MLELKCIDSIVNVIVVYGNVRVLYELFVCVYGGVEVFDVKCWCVVCEFGIKIMCRLWNMCNCRIF